MVLPRLPGRLADGWEGTEVALPAGTWTDVLTDEKVDGDRQRVEDLWRRFPVAVLGRQD